MVQSLYGRVLSIDLGPRRLDEEWKVEHRPPRLKNGALLKDVMVFLVLETLVGADIQ
jgi:hypothetical protein